MTDGVIIGAILSSPVVVFIVQKVWEMFHTNRAEREFREKVLATIQDMQMELLRVQFNQLVFQEPKNKQAISQVYDKYHANGGNSYITQRYEKWKKTGK